MKTIHLDTSAPLLPPCVATIGFFDGVHLGHRHLIEQVKAEARRAGLASAVVTFATHPRQVVSAGYVPQLLTSLPQKLELLAQTGVDEAVVLPFDRCMAALSAHDFMHDILKRRIAAATLITGYDNRFGHNRAEGFADYVRYGAEMGMRVVQGEALTVDGVNVSSSVIRRLLNEGCAADAARFLGRRYTIGGRVERGFQEGRRMGFPTANIAPSLPEQLIPKCGAYAARLRIGQVAPGDDKRGRLPHVRPYKAHHRGAHHRLHCRHLRRDGDGGVRQTAARRTPLRRRGGPESTAVCRPPDDTRHT